ncbi:unnamed protein product [Closterium sp. NIES-54]
MNGPEERGGRVAGGSGEAQAQGQPRDSAMAPMQPSLGPPRDEPRVFGLDKFNGDNFAEWSFKMENIFDHDDLLEVMEGTEKRPEHDPEESLWVRKSAQCYLLLGQVLGSSQIRHVKPFQREPEKGPKAWATLKGVHALATAAVAVVLERQMAALRIEEDEAVEEGVQKFVDLLTRLEGADLNYSELQKKTKLVALLPESWSSLIINLNRDLPHLSLEDVKRAMLQEDFRRRELASADGAGAASIGRGYGRGRGRGRGEMAILPFKRMSQKPIGTLTASAAPAYCANMASLRVLAFDHEGRPVQFDTWLDDLQLYLQSDIKDDISLFDHVSGATIAPPTTADSATRSQWLSRDAAARLAIRNHLPLAKCAHFGQHRTAQAMYDAVVARYSSPASAALSRLLLPYLFPELSAFATVEDLNQPPMFITLYFIVTRLHDSLRSVRDHFLSLDPTSLTIDLLEQHLLAAETSAIAVGAAHGTPCPPFIEGCSPSPLAPSYASAAAANVSDAEDVGAASASAYRRSGKSKGGKGGGGGSGGDGGGSGSSGGASSGGGGGGGTGGGSGGSGGGGGGSGGSGGGGGSGTGGGGAGARHVGSEVGQRQQQQRRSETQLPQQLREWFLRGASGGSCPYVIRTGDRAGQTCGRLHTQHRCFSLEDAWPAEFGDDVELPCWADLLSAEGDCYRCVPPDPGIAAAALGASESGTLPGSASAQDLHTFTLDSGASACFFRDTTTLTPLSTPVPVRLADPSRGPVMARSSTVLPCPAVPSGSLSGLHLPSFSANLVSTAALQDAMVTTTTPRGQRVMICTCTRTGRHLATFTRRPRSSLYTLAIEPPQVAASAKVSASGKCAAPHSSSFPPTTAPLQTLHMDVWGPARVSGQSRKRYFQLLIDEYTRYTTVSPLRSMGQVVDVLIPWICTVRLQLCERFGQDLPIVRLHYDRGGEFSSNLLRDFCREEGILQSFMLPDSPQQNGTAERRIGLVMEVACTSMIHAAAPHFMWLFAVQYAAHQLNLWPRVSLLETSPTLCWTGEVGDASVLQVWGSRAFVRYTFTHKLSPHAIPCVFLDFVPDAPGWQFYHPNPRRVFPSQDVMFDESVPFYYPLLPEGPAPSGVSQVDPVPRLAPVQVAVGSGAPRGAASGGAEPGGAESEGAETGGAEPGGVEIGSGEPEGAEPEGVERGDAASKGAEFGGAEPQGAASSGLSAGAGVAARAGVTGGTATTGPGGARSWGTGAAGTGGVEGAGAGDPMESRATSAGGSGAGGAGAGGAGVGGTGARGIGVGGPGVGGAGDGGAGGVDSRGAVRPRPYFVPLLQQPASPLPDPSPYTEQSGGLIECREPASRPVSLVCTACRVPRSRLLLSPPTISRLLATAATDPSFESAAVLALVAELLEFAAACHLDYATALVAESASASPLSIGGECALGTDVLEDRQEDFKCLAAAAPRVASMLLTPEGDPDAPDIPTPRSYAEAITGTQWSLRRPVYGLRQAPREWHDTLRTTLAALGFAPSTADPSLFLRTDTSLPPFYVLVYVDDLVFATGDSEELTLFKLELQKRHTCTHLGELRSYLGLQITRDRARCTITLTQSHMVHQVLQRFGFQFSSPQPTPLSTSHLLSAPPSDESVEPSGAYPELVGCHMYPMTCSRPDLAYPLCLLARYVALCRHRKVHWDASKRVLRYLCSTSSCEAEIYAGAMAAQELRWLTYQLNDLGEQPRSPPVLYVNNKAMIALCQEHRLEHKMKHIPLRYFLAWELQQRGQICLVYVATRANTADIFTKALPPGDHQRFSTELDLVPTLPHLLTA